MNAMTDRPKNDGKETFEAPLAMRIGAGSGEHKET